MMTNKFRLGRNRSLSLISALILFLGVCIIQANAPAVSAQNVSNSILEVVPATPLSSVASGAQGTFFVEMPVFLNRTVNTSNCTVAASLQPSFFNGGNMVGTLRIWGVRTGGSTGNVTNTTAGTQATNVTNTAIAVVNMSLDLPSFNGTIEMQGTLGRIRFVDRPRLLEQGSRGINITARKRRLSGVKTLYAPQRLGPARKTRRRKDGFIQASRGYGASGHHR